MVALLHRLRAVVVAAVVLFPEGALAGKKECVRAFDEGQRAQSSHALVRARDELRTCAAAECPRVLQADCARVLEDVRAAIPTVVFAALDAEGNDVVGARVFLDQTLLPTDGKAREVDPGAHKLRVEPDSPFLAQEIDVVLKEGEKNRRVVVRLVKVAPKVAERPAIPTRTPEVEPPPRSTVGYAVPAALGAVGITALAFAVGSKVALDSHVDELRATCAPTCSEDVRADASAMLVRTNAALVVGLTAVGLAVISYFVFSPAAGSRPARPTAVLTW